MPTEVMSSNVAACGYIDNRRKRRCNLVARAACVHGPVHWQCCWLPQSPSAQRVPSLYVFLCDPSSAGRAVPATCARQGRSVYGSAACANCFRGQARNHSRRARHRWNGRWLMACASANGEPMNFASLESSHSYATTVPLRVQNSPARATARCQSFLLMVTRKKFCDLGVRGDARTNVS